MLIACRALILIKVTFLISMCFQTVGFMFLVTNVFKTRHLNWLTVASVSTPGVWPTGIPLHNQTSK